MAEGSDVTQDLVSRLLPVLGRSLEAGFNVFDVMHHGLHEKQLSNVFRWLLDSGGTHRLGETFVGIFVDEINQTSTSVEALPEGGYIIRQEVNTSPSGTGADIADLVLENKTACIVVENYYTSDGHGHSYDGYLAYSRREGRRGEVVLLCRDTDVALQSKGWQHAPVLTYATLLQRLFTVVSSDPT